MGFATELLFAMLGHYPLYSCEQFEFVHRTMSIAKKFVYLTMSVVQRKIVAMIDFVAGSRYYQNELRKEKQTNAKIEEQKRRIAELDENLIKQGETEACRLIKNELECF